MTLTFKALYSVQQIRDMGEHARQLIDKSWAVGGMIKRGDNQLIEAQGNAKRFDSKVEVFARMMQAACKQGTSHGRGLARPFSPQLS